MAWCATSRSEQVTRQRGKGIVDSLSQRSGNLDVQLGRQRFPYANPLCAIVLGQHVTQGADQSIRAAKQIVGGGRMGSALPQNFYRHSFGFDRVRTFRLQNELVDIGADHSLSSTKF
jgi:hypothetical protein